MPLLMKPATLASGVNTKLTPGNSTSEKAFPMMLCPSVVRWR